MTRAESTSGLLIRLSQVRALAGEENYRIGIRRLELLVEALVEHEGVAVTGELQNAGVTNPSEAFNELQKWQSGILAPFLEAPGRGRKGTGNKARIVAAK